MSAIDTIAATIQTIEGWYPGSLSYRNNNPGNLVYAGQAGAVPGAGGFAFFQSYEAGLDALKAQIQLYAARGLSILQMMSIYAPATDSKGNPTGNNPVAYAGSIAGALGVDPGTAVSDALGGQSFVEAADAAVSGEPDSGTVIAWVLGGVFAAFVVAEVIA